MPPVPAVLYSNCVMASGDLGEGKFGPLAEHASAVKLQKVYRSYRTRRRLADTAVLAEELWWQAIEYVRLNHSTISFFNYPQPETVQSRWNRVSCNAAKIGKGALGNKHSVKLAFQHWIEAIDPRHRYGHNLHYYYERWCESTDGQPFFFWLDAGDGRDVDLRECPRSVLREQCILYLGPQEREHYEYVPRGGKLVHMQTGELLETTAGPEKGKWIFVMSTSKRLYAGRKKKGRFHHSSFLAGGATLAAGRLVAEAGILKAIWAYSGHYRPSRENLNNFLDFLKENGVPVDEEQVCSCSNEEYEDPKPAEEATPAEAPAAEPEDEAPPPAIPPVLQIPEGMSALRVELALPVPEDGYKRTLSGRFLSGGIQSPRAAVPQNVILKRINSRKEATSYQLGHQLSLKWSTGAGPRIGCIADYPTQVREQALEILNLSPKAPARTPRRGSSSQPPSSPLAAPPPS